MNDVLFRDARLKIKRANQHIEDLNNVLSSFLDTDFYDLSVKNDPDSGERFLQYSASPIPENAALIVGDAIHNLRTSLDFVASDVVCKANGSTRYTRFPFGNSRKEVESAIKGGSIKVASASVISAILDQIKPYKGGDDALWGLHSLDIMDKHLLVIPALAFISLAHVDLKWGGFEMIDCSYLAEAGCKIRMAGGPADELHITNKGNPSVEVVFGQGQPFQMEPVIPVLHQLSQLVSRCVDAISEAYLASV